MNNIFSKLSPLSGIDSKGIPSQPFKRSLDVVRWVISCICIGTVTILTNDAESKSLVNKNFIHVENRYNRFTLWSFF